MQLGNIPKISVIMSVYNGEKYLAEAIESVRSQTFKDWELIAVDDCSADNTKKILDKYSELDSRIKVYPNEVNMKLPSSLNKALALAKGKYIVRMDADDICLADRFEKQYEFMESNPEVDLSSCRFMTLKGDTVSSGGGGGRCDSEAVKALLLFTNPILHPGVIAKSDIMKKMKYDTSLTCTEDLELWTRYAAENYKMEIQDEYLMLYRIHDKQITGTTLERQHGEVTAIQRKYYSILLEAMSEEEEQFYINGIYFRENIDINKFCGFYRKIKSVNKRTKSFDGEALAYAAFEILAEYKRCGISKKELVRGMMCFGIPFLIKEFTRKKKQAYKDGSKCIKAAEKIGLKHSNENVEFPVFAKLR